MVNIYNLTFNANNAPNPWSFAQTKLAIFWTSNINSFEFAIILLLYLSSLLSSLKDKYFTICITLVTTNNIATQHYIIRLKKKKEFVFIQDCNCLLIMLGHYACSILWFSYNLRRKWIWNFKQQRETMLCIKVISYIKYIKVGIISMKYLYVILVLNP